MFNFGEDILDNYRDLLSNLEDVKNEIADVKVSSAEEFQKKEKLLQTVTEDIASAKSFIAQRLEKEVF